jgi:hypothetical protein
MLIASLVVALPVFAQAASEPRYTYAEIAYVNLDFDDIDVDGDGFGLGGSYALHPNIHAVADYYDVDLDGNADAQAVSFGAGVNFPFRPGLDGVARLRWIEQEVDVGPFSDDVDGYGLEAGLRTMINPRLELNGGIDYVDLDDEDDTSFFFGALYDVVPNFALGGDIEISDDATVLVLKGRFYFRSAITGR